MHRGAQIQSEAKFKLAQCTYEEGLKICCKEAVMQTETNTTYRKCKEAAHMSLVDQPNSQPSSDICPFWSPIIAAEVRKL
jgi:hypothetical protein